MFKIYIGCPVHNRDWILPYYLNHIFNINYPKKLITLSFIINDSHDNSLNLLLNFKNQHQNEYNKIIVETHNFNMPKDIRHNRLSNKIYKRIADVRNIFLSYIDDEDYVFSVDSDILVPKDILNCLLEDNKDIVSALVYNDEKKIYPNILINNNGNIVHYIGFPKNSLFEVDITGAVYLLKSEVCKKVKYDYHYLGEDVPFCFNAKKLGYKIWCDSRIICDHIMYPNMLKPFL